MQKKYLVIPFSLGIGFCCGRLSSSHLEKKKEVFQTKEAQQAQFVQQVKIHQDTQEDSTIVKETTVEKKYYAHDGKLRETIHLVTDFGAKTQTDINLFSLSHKVDNSQSSSITKDNTVETSQSNWLIKVGYEPTMTCVTQFCANNFSAGLGYRIIGSFYVAASINATFNRIQTDVIFFLP